MHAGTIYSIMPNAKSHHVLLLRIKTSKKKLPAAQLCATTRSRNTIAYWDHFVATFNLSNQSLSHRYASVWEGGETRKKKKKWPLNSNLLNPLSDGHPQHRILVWTWIHKYLHNVGTDILPTGLTPTLLCPLVSQKKTTVCLLPDVKKYPRRNTMQQHLY